MKPCQGSKFRSYPCTMGLLAILLLLLAAKRCCALKLYPYLMNPLDNPQHDRYAVAHPSLDVFDRVPEFATLRYPLSSKYSNYTDLVDLYCLDPQTTLGRVIWPGTIDVLANDQFHDFVDFVASKGLYVSAIHSAPPFAAVPPVPQQALRHLEAALGGRWFGMSNGEEDGHYAFFAYEELPHNADGRRQYLHFRDYFNGLETLFGPRMTTLLASTYPHYQLKSGLYTEAGAETSQRDPNAQLRYAFIRGAGKQYGVIWTGNVSVYNRFGHKAYEKPSAKAAARRKKTRSQSSLRADEHSAGRRNYTCAAATSNAGPACGTSLNLMKRLMYAQIMYNSGYVSFEGGWFYKQPPFTSTLTPIGLMQHNAYLWSQKMPSFGVHVPTVALYLDFFNGWSAPRDKPSYEFLTWNSLPYQAGDYLSDGLLRMVYPQYQDASYFHDETGASSATPYGDCLDVLLSDAPSWVLRQYDTLLVSSSLGGGLEVEHNLFEYLSGGGNLVLTAANLARLPNGSLGVTAADVDDCKPVPAGGQVWLWNGKEVTERYGMTVCNVSCQAQDCTILAKLGDSTPLAVQRRTKNGGSLIVFASPYAVSSELVAKPVSQIDESLPSPYPLLTHAQILLDAILLNASLFSSPGANLSLVPSFNGADQFLVLVTNPELRQQPLKLTSAQGTIDSVEEIELDESEKGGEGYLPDGFQGTDIGNSTAMMIAGGDTRLFSAKLSSQTLQVLLKVSPKPRPKGVGLHLRGVEHSIRYEILLRPSFFQHYDSVVVDLAYLTERDTEFLKTEHRWLELQSVSVYVDASDAIDAFPGIRLTRDDGEFYNASMETLTEVMSKANALGSRNIVLSLHKYPLKWPKNQSLEDFNATLHHLNGIASTLNLTLHMLDAAKNPMAIRVLNNWLINNGLVSIRLVLSLARLVTYGYNQHYDALVSSRSSLLYVDAPGWDVLGYHFADNLPLAQVNATVREETVEMLEHVCSLRQCPYRSGETASSGYREPARGGSARRSSQRSPDAVYYPLVMDAAYESQDDEFADVNIVENVLL